MRIVIWERDDNFGTREARIDMNPEVVDLGNRLIPLSYAYNFNHGVYGWVSDARLEDGEIVADATLSKKTTEKLLADLLAHKNIQFGGYYTNVVREPAPDGLSERVVSCALRGVSFFMAPIPFGISTSSQPSGDVKE